jgi:AcrR family transcriptional regulator
MEKRPYRMKVRAERQADTRRRIVEAAVELHSTAGPSATSLSAVAERAGVQRHTLYAHFPDADSLFRACTIHWRDAHPFPEPTTDLREGLRALYDWYASVADAFAIFARDAYLYPAFWQEQLDALDAYAARMAAPLGRSRALRARVAHAVEFETWRSLVQRRGLSRNEAVDAMADLVGAAHRG